MSVDRDFLKRVRSLDEHELRRLGIVVEGLLAETKAKSEKDTVTYRKEFVRCGREGCTKCPHGPYWYAYFREGGKVRSRYIGKRDPAPQR